MHDCVWEYNQSTFHWHGQRKIFALNAHEKQFFSNFTGANTRKRNPWKRCVSSTSTYKSSFHSSSGCAFPTFRGFLTSSNLLLLAFPFDATCTFITCEINHPHNFLSLHSTMLYILFKCEIIDIFFFSLRIKDWVAIAYTTGERYIFLISTRI